MRAILAGGGTGGHVIPAIAIAQQLRDSYGAEVLFIGTERGIESRLVPPAGFKLRLVEVGQLKRVSLATRLKTLTALPRAVVAAWAAMTEFRPDVVIGVGGYASGPAMLAAGLRGTPSLIFEPNVVPGFANRVVAFMAGAAAVHFEQTRRWFRNCEVTGVPVRREFFQVPPRRPGDSPTLLLFGGSQGSRALNRVLVDSLPALIQRIPNLHVIHQTGEREYEAVAADYLRGHISAEVSPFIADMAGAFTQADLLVCRSGASTVAEVAAAGKPAIFVPLPTAADDHQLRNAETLAGQNAAMLIGEAELTPERFVDAVAALITDRPRLEAMGNSARRLAHDDAAAHIARMAARLAGVPAAGAPASP
jgi:UDP-N-acetylglucosamine--N-acetylmuramyl-(pentapeptide) pyrophosphoryl-undecaprenol N-acetylglucosamine transferase